MSLFFFNLDFLFSCSVLVFWVKIQFRFLLILFRFLVTPPRQLGFKWRLPQVIAYRETLWDCHSYDVFDGCDGITVVGLHSEKRNEETSCVFFLCCNWEKLNLEKKNVLNSDSCATLAFRWFYREGTDYTIKDSLWPIRNLIKESFDFKCSAQKLILSQISLLIAT